MHVLLNTSRAMIGLVKSFVSDSECDAMLDKARPSMASATVSEEGNNNAVSQYRRAQAGNVYGDPRASGPISDVVRRNFDFANAVTDYKLSQEGQEPFSVIQYLPGQEYRPHCDGSCDGSPWSLFGLGG